MITNTMVHQGKISNFEKFHHVNELSSFKKLRNFADGTCVFNIRPARLYASSKAPRCPFCMIFQVQLLVCSVQRRPLHIWMLHKHIIKTH